MEIHCVCSVNHVSATHYGGHDHGEVGTDGLPELGRGRVYELVDEIPVRQ